MKLGSLSSRWWFIVSRNRTAASLVGAIALLLIGWLTKPLWYPQALEPSSLKTDGDTKSNASVDRQPDDGLSSVVLDNWQEAGVKLGKLTKSSFSQTIRLTGRVSLNEDQISHIYPMVEGSASQVPIGLGQSVKANDILVVVHSRVIGQAKLELYQARLAKEMAVVKDKLQQELAENTRVLLSALREFKPIERIESEFRNRSMGEYRERLLLAYSNYLKSDAEAQRLESIASDGAISAKQLHTAQASRNSDQAIFQARIEQIEFELRTSLILSEQAVKEAATRVAVAETNLRILGCEEGDISSIDPQTQGQSISNYTIRAPFDGTIISKDVTVREQVRPDAQILSVADLSTVWITADIYQQHVPLLSSVSGKHVRVFNDAWPDRAFDATVFYTGEIMDETTRTIAMRASAKNDEHLLKPGMFVTIEVSGQVDQTPVLQIPNSAILEHQSKRFVFVHTQGDQFQPREISIGQNNSVDSVVLEGLSEADQIVLKGGFVLKSKLLAELMGEE